MDFFRTYTHLLPTGAAWRITIQKTLRRFFQGLAGTPTDARGYIDDVFDDAFPSTTRELAAWEDQFGLQPNPDDSIRRLNLAAEWAATGGQSPSYIQGVLQTAGFDLYVHEWWASGPPYVANDPRDYTDQPLIGSGQCTATGVAGQPQCGDGAIRVEVEPGVRQYQCDRFLQNDPHYLVNLNLTEEAPPPVPDDPATWPYFIYIGALTFPEIAEVPEERRAEFERLILKMRPLQNWIVTLIHYSCGMSLGLAYDSAREDPDLLTADGYHPDCGLSEGLRYAIERGTLLP
jgi:hypothetical protein